MSEDRGWYVIGLIVLIIIVFILVRSLRPKTVIEEIVRDEEGRIVQIVRRET